MAGAALGFAITFLAGAAFFAAAGLALGTTAAFLVVAAPADLDVDVVLGLGAARTTFLATTFALGLAATLGFATTLGFALAAIFALEAGLAAGLF